MNYYNEFDVGAKNGGHMTGGHVTFGSVCSGIEAASVAWEQLGWKAAWLSEIEPFPCAVLAHHWPDTPNLGDMTTIEKKIRAGQVSAPEVFTGGTPCQAFSVAGKRESLSDDRGNLSLTFCEIADAIDDIRHHRGEQPAVIVWENVPGVLSTRDNAFGCFLAGLAGDDQPIEPGPRPEQGRSSAHWAWKKDACQHVPKWSKSGLIVGPRRTVAWRIIDAQYFGVAQRRRRVFVVASAREGFCPGSVLFEFEGVRRDSAPSRPQGQEAAGAATDGTEKWPAELAATLNAAFAEKQGLEDQHINGGASWFVPVVGALTAKGPEAMGSPEVDGNHYVVHGTQDPIVGVNVTHTIGRNGGQENALTFDVKGGLAPHGTPALDSVPRTLKASDCYDPQVVVRAGQRVRRLTPEECERLQGFPTGHTMVPFRGRQASSGPRYKAIGNSWAVPCAEWIGRRISQQIGWKP